MFNCSVVSDSLRPHGLYVAYQGPLSIGFSRKEYWSRLPFPSPIPSCLLRDNFYTLPLSLSFAFPSMFKTLLLSSINNNICASSLDYTCGFNFSPLQSLSFPLQQSDSENCDCSLSPISSNSLRFLPPALQ